VGSRGATGAPEAGPKSLVCAVIGPIGKALSAVDGWFWPLQTRQIML
jgi:hypothetical protein